jgi:hypothetical protein
MHFLNAMLSIALTFGSLAQEYWPAQWNKKSILTTEGQVELPGIVLDPGSYIVRLHENGEKRSLVQILDRSETQVLATVLAVPDHRMRPEGDGEFTYHEVRTGKPRPIRAWYYTSDVVGLEFVYPKVRARDLAKASNEHVMAANSKDGVILAVTPNGKEIVIEKPVQSARQKPQ